MEERTRRREQNECQTGGEEKRNGRLQGAAQTSKERAEWHRPQQKNLSILGLPKRKEWPQCHRESSRQKRLSRLFKAPDHEGGESQGGQQPHPGERGDQSESTERKGRTPPRRKADSKQKREGKQEEPPQNK